jgi:hypothetical protein
MEVIVPLEISLAYTGSSPTYIYSAWAAGQAYIVGDIRRYQISGLYRDFRCKVAHTSSTANAPDKMVTTATTTGWWIFTQTTYTTQSYWEDRGPSATSGGYTYTTNVRLSNYPTWSTGAAVSLNAAVYDPANNHDYLATIAVSSGDNTIRPSEAIKSSDETIAARWIDLGASNAWAAIDYLGNTYTQGYETDGDLCDPAFTVTCSCATAVNRVCFAGLVNIKTVAITVTDDGVAHDQISVSLTPSGTTYGATLRTTNISLASTVAAGSAMSIAVVLTRNDTSKPAQCAVMTVGMAHQISYTEWGVETSTISFSRKERDDVYGTVNFMKRGSSRQIRATCFVDPDVITGDVVQELLSQWDGMPVYWDFNNSSPGYDRLRAFGFYTNLGMAIPAYSYESLSLTVEGLVE